MKKTFELISTDRGNGVALRIENGDASECMLYGRRTGSIEMVGETQSIRELIVLLPDFSSLDEIETWLPANGWQQTEYLKYLQR